MNDDARLERLFEDGLHDIAPLRAPDRLRTQVKTETTRVRPHRRWLVLIKEPPMRTNSRLAVGSPTARVAAIMVATLLAAAMIVGAGIAGAQLFAADGPIVVDQTGSGAYTTLADAVAVAGDGDEILIRPGTYTEAVIVDKDITIRGDGPVEDIVLTAPDDGPTRDSGHSMMRPAPYALLLEGTEARISAFTLRGEPSRLFASGGSPVIEKLVFDSVGIEYDYTPVVGGLVVNGGSTATVRDNTLTGGGSIHVFELSAPLIEDNSLVDGPAIAGQFGNAAIIRGNEISGQGVQGVSFISPSAALVESNTITDRDTGIVGNASSAFTATILGNTISRALNAIEVPSGQPEITGNTLIDSDVGIYMPGSSSLVVNNAISGNRVGISLGTDSAATLTGNTICGNEVNLHVPDGVEPPDASGNEVCEDAPVE